MIGLILIYFIGRQFYELAHEYKRHRWGFTILGVASYYIGTFIAGFAIGLIDFFTGSNLTGSSRLTLSLIAVPFGLLTCLALYKILQLVWRRNRTVNNAEILDDGDVI